MTRSNYCKHGTYIGDPYGPDYLCYWCEMGIDPPPPPKWELAGTYTPTAENVNEVIARFIADRDAYEAAGYQCRTRTPDNDPASFVLQVSKS